MNEKTRKQKRQKGGHRKVDSPCSHYSRSDRAGQKFQPTGAQK